jgi:anaerobic dimethyl sulfoxide reductase subunit C
VLVFVMAKIYMLEIVPAWNTLFTPASFYFSSFIFGGITFLAGVLFFMRNTGTGSLYSPEFIFTAKIIIGILALLLFFEAAAWIYQIILLSSGDRAAVESYNAIINGNIVFFFSRIVLQAAGFALLAFSFVLLKNGILNEKYIFLSYALILLAQIIGRYLFYAMYARTGV